MKSRLADAGVPGNSIWQGVSDRGWNPGWQMLIDQARPSDQEWSDSVSPDFTSLHVRSSLQVAAGATGWLRENLWVLILLLTVHMVQLYLPILGPVASCAHSRYNNDSRSNFLWRVFVSLDDPLMEKNPLRSYSMSGVPAKTTNLCLTQLRYRGASITVFMIKSYSFDN